MTIELIVIGKTDMKEVEHLIGMYTKRIGFYTKFTIHTIPDIRNSKNLSEAMQKSVEGEAILKRINDSDFVVLLDERGKEFRSTEFAAWLEKRMASGLKRLIFVIGGPYGFSDAVYARSNDKVSLSKMTFSHQIIRTIFAEQLYRAFSIINNEPYHHE